MTKNSHFIINTVFAFPVLIVKTNGFTQMETADIAFCVSFIMAASLPDTLEFSYKTAQGYRRLIPHRTITHWWLIWVLPFFFLSPLSIAIAGGYAVGHMEYRVLIETAIKGILWGGLTHIAMDLLTPAGVPLLLPTAKHRVSLNLCKTGREFWVVSSFSFMAIGLGVLKLGNLSNL